MQAMKDLLVTPEGLTKTRTYDGCVSIRCYETEEDTMVIFQEWDSKNTMHTIKCAKKKVCWIK